MDHLRIPITERARKYGYLTWTKDDDEKVVQLIGNRKTIRVVLNGADLLEKRIDWKYRRISLGYKHTRRIPSDATEFLVEFDPAEGMEISVE